MYQVDLARYYKQKECYLRGETILDISPEEAKELYREHLKTGVPFKGRKGKKVDRAVNLPSDGLPGAGLLADDDDDDETDDSEGLGGPPPAKVARTKTTIQPKPAKARLI